ncbi:Acyl-CoA synthetase member 3, mitochondrial [Phlyctochytrium bullatum]|nr:Acyl-CoA synthetase member 3, mitochondrial [Phlyctochytrium bullatum]
MRAMAHDPSERSHPAIIDLSRTVTHSQLLTDASRVQETYLQKVYAKSGAGDRVAFLAPRNYAHALLQWSTWIRGAVAVPLCTSHKPAEMAHVISDSSPKVVFFTKEFRSLVDGEVRKHDMIRDMKSPVAEWIEIDNVDAIRSDHGAGNDSRLDVSWTPIDKTQGALIIYTSGTTGRPKGVLSTFQNVEAQVSSLLQAWEWSKSDRIQLLLPLHHVHGVINVLTCGLAAGATVEMEPGRFDPTAVWKRWMDPSRNLTLFMAVPTVYGSSALPEPLAHEWRDISGHQLLERYGMTEIGMALGNPLRDNPRVAGTVGIPFPGIQCRLVDENGEVVPEPETGAEQRPGELQVKGPQVFKEYWGRPDATAETFTEDGWFKTGDIATRIPVPSSTPPTHYHKILGRASVDILKTGGHKLSALSIERELLSHPAVTDAAVVGVPDDVWGERVAAVVVTTGEVEAAELRAWMRERVANWEVPSLWRVVGEMPRNAMGKVNKKELRRVFEA